MIFAFQGHSDDTFGLINQSTEDYDNGACGKPIVFQLEAPDGQRVNVVGQYAVMNLEGSWLVGLMPAETATRVETGTPDWGFKYLHGQHPYSPTLQVDAPEGTKIRRVYPEPEEPAQ